MHFDVILSRGTAVINALKAAVYSAFITTSAVSVFLKGNGRDKGLLARARVVGKVS